MRKERKSTIFIGTIGLSLVMVVICVIIMNVNINKSSFSKTFEEYKTRANNSSVDYKDYFDVEKKVAIVRESRNEKTINTLSYYIRWGNKTDKPINFNWQAYCSDELRDKYVNVAEPMCLAWGEPLVIEVNSGLRYQYAPPILEYRKDDEKFIELYNELYIEMSINGEFCYFTLQFEE